MSAIKPSTALIIAMAAPIILGVLISSVCSSSMLNCARIEVLRHSL